MNGAVVDFALLAFVPVIHAVVGGGEGVGDHVVQGSGFVGHWSFLGDLVLLYSCVGGLRDLYLDVLPGTGVAE